MQCSNTQVPTFSTIDFSDESLVIKTYDYNGNKYADDYTLYKTGKNVSMKELISEAKSIKNDNYTEDSWKTLQAEIEKAENLMQYTAKDKGAEQLAAVYDKTNDGDNEKDMVNYYGYAQGSYQKDGTTTLLTGFSTLLDKTMDTKLIIEKKIFENQYNNLLKAKVGLQKKAETPKTTPVKKTAKLVLKVGKKVVTGKTYTLKKGKTATVKATVTDAKGKKVTSGNQKITWTTSNKKVATISKSGKITAKKAGTVKITAKTADGKKVTFKVKVK